MSLVAAVISTTPSAAPCRHQHCVAICIFRLAEANITRAEPKIGRGRTEQEACRFDMEIIDANAGRRFAFHVRRAAADRA